MIYRDYDNKVIKYPLDKNRIDTVDCPPLSIHHTPADTKNTRMVN